jgi:IclR family KDG regulon transcriptional repressor
MSANDAPIDEAGSGEDQRGTSLGRGLAVLMALGSPEASAAGGLGVVALSTLLGRDKSQVSRTLKVLASTGLVERDPSDLTYHLGWRLYTLARQAGDRRLLLAARPVLRGLVEEFAESAHISTLVGVEVLTVASEDPSRSIMAAQHVGTLVPASCTSSGRALLIDYPKEDLRRLFRGVDMAAGGPGAPRSVDELVTRLAADRRRGFVLADEESEADHLAVAAPIRRFDCRVIAAVNVSAPKGRFLDRVTAAGAAVAEAALSLSTTVGYDPTTKGLS